MKNLGSIAPTVACLVVRLMWASVIVFLIFYEQNYVDLKVASLRGMARIFVVRV